MSGEWKSVTMYECPHCGELVQDMDDACCHVCENKLSGHDLEQFIEWLDAKSMVAWSRKTAIQEFANETPLWNEYVEDAHSE